MKNNYSFFISMLLLLTTFSSMAQPGWTIYNNTNTILSSGTYKTISIDQSGNVWVGGSYTGLYEFNGTTWIKYSTSNSNILHNDINDIVIDNSNKVWAANYKGISVFNGTTFINYDTLNAGFNGMTVYALGKDNNGIIWLSSRNGSFGYEGITTFDGTTWTNLTGYPSQILGDEFPDFVFTSSNVAWIASESGIVKYTGGIFTFYPKAYTGLWSSSTLTIDASANIWAAGFDGLLKYNGSTWTFFDNVTNLGLTSNNLYYDIFPDGNILWIASYDGLLKFDRNTETILANYNASNSPLSDNCVSQITKDVNGNLWLATTIGIVKMVPSQVSAVEELNNYHPIDIYPNPFSSSTTLQMNKIFKKATLTVYNSIGLTVKQIDNLTGQTIIFDRDDLTSGLYFIQLTQGNKNFSVDKLIITDN